MNIRYYLWRKIERINSKRRNFGKGLFTKNLYEDKALPVNPVAPQKELNKENPVIFFDIKIWDKEAKRVEIELCKAKC